MNRLLSTLLCLLLAACGGDSVSPRLGTPGPTPQPSTDKPYADLAAGSFALTLSNGTRGQWRDDQIYITIVGVNGPAPDGAITYVRPTATRVVGAPPRPGTTETLQGVLAEVRMGSAADNTSPGCIAAAGSCFVPYAFTLADLGPERTLFLPGDGKYYGSRIYVSIGRPLLQQVSPDGRGISQPNIESSTDPNFTTVFDWFEFTYDPVKTPAPIPFGGNVTQVDLYSVPLMFEVIGVNDTRMTRGISVGADSSSGAATRDELFAMYRASVGPAFADLAQMDGDAIVRLIAPYHAANFGPGGADAAYFDAYVDQVWSQFASDPGSLDFRDQPPLPDGTPQGNRFYGCTPAEVQVHPDRLCFKYTPAADTDVSTGPFYIAKPSSYDVLTNGGALQPGCKSSADYSECNAFGAQLAAALNRAVAHLPAQWRNAQAFYLQDPKNDWAQFWHKVSIDGRAYGMGFDDVADQSSVAILPLRENILQLTLTIGW